MHAWESLDFEKCTWADEAGVDFPFTLKTNEFVWHVEYLSDLGEEAVDGAATSGSFWMLPGQGLPILDLFHAI